MKFHDDVFPELCAADALLALEDGGDDRCECVGFGCARCAPILDDGCKEGEIVDGLCERVVLVRVEHDVVHQAERVHVS